MRSIVLAVVTTLWLGSWALVHAEEPRPVSDVSRNQVTIEVRYVSVNQSMFESIGLGNELLIPPAVEPEPLFSPVTVAKDGTSAIQLISASYVVEERKPIHALVLNNQQTLELMKLVQGDRRVTYLHSPKVTVWDRETAEIASVTQRPFGRGCAERSDRCARLTRGNYAGGPSQCVGFGGHPTRLAVSGGSDRGSGCL